MVDFVPPVAARDVIKVRPAFERVQKAQEALDKAKSEREDVLAKVSAEIRDAGDEDLTRKEISERAATDERVVVADKAAASAEAALKAAEANLADNDVTYYLKPPTGRTRAAAQRDLAYEGVTIHDNGKLADAIIESDAIGDEDRAFAKRVKANISADASIPDADWTRLWELARTIPAGREIIADRGYFIAVLRTHLLRHHLSIKGFRSPVDEAVIDAIPPEDQAILSARLDEITSPTKAVAKN